MLHALDRPQMPCPECIPKRPVVQVEVPSTTPLVRNPRMAGLEAEEMSAFSGQTRWGDVLMVAPSLLDHVKGVVERDYMLLDFECFSIEFHYF